MTDINGAGGKTIAWQALIEGEFLQFIGAMQFNCNHVLEECKKHVPDVKDKACQIFVTNLFVESLISVCLERITSLLRTVSPALEADIIVAIKQKFEQLRQDNPQTLGATGPQLVQPSAPGN